MAFRIYAIPPASNDRREKMLSEIKTSRLRVIPLTLNQFALLLESPQKLESILHLNSSNTLLEGHERDAMQWLYTMALSCPEQHLWFTNWQIVLSSANVSIGSSCFKGDPNDKGEVELGYGINSAYRNQGYMTEAAESLCHWAIKQPGVTSVIAETDKDNPASQRVCAKSGMIQSGETASTILWRFDQRNLRE